jgi:hypothetical protein
MRNCRLRAASFISLLLLLAPTTSGSGLDHMRAHGHDHQHKHKDHGSSSTTTTTTTNSGTSNSTRCVAKRFPCAELGRSCTRPRSVFFFKLRGTGGKGFGEGVLNHLFTREDMLVAEGWSLSHAPTVAKLASLEGRGSGGIASRALRVTILRHPVERIISRYWFEGRWPLFHRGELTEATATSFSAWFNRTKCGPDGSDGSSDRRGGRLWQCSSNYYVKSFSGWNGKAMCRSGGGGGGSRDGSGNDDSGSGGCVGGVGPSQVAAAKAALQSGFDVVLLTEWLAAPPQVALLADALCFATDGRGRTPLRRHPPGHPSLAGRAAAVGGEAREIPSFRPVRPAGGHAKLRPSSSSSSATTTTNAMALAASLPPDELAALERANGLDLELYRWAQEKLVRPRIAAFLRDHPPPPLSPNSPSDDQHTTFDVSALPPTPG